jgi:hypothetical protein
MAGGHSADLVGSLWPHTARKRSPVTALEGSIRDGEALCRQLNHRTGPAWQSPIDCDTAGSAYSLAVSAEPAGH